VFSFFYESGGNRRRTFKASGTVCTIGSARSNDLVVEGRRMGKRHAELRLEHDGVHLEDLGGGSGCWVNHERVQHHGPLCDLDEVTVGDVTLTLDGSPLPPETEVTVPVRERSQTQGTNRPPARRPFLRALGLGRSTVDAIPVTSPDGEAPVNGHPPRDAGVPGLDDGAPPVDDAGDDIASTRDAVPAPIFGAASGTGDAPAPDTQPVKLDERLAYWGASVHEQLLYQMDLRRKDVNRMSDDQLRSESRQLIGAIVASLEEELPHDLDRDALRSNVLDESVGLGPLERFLADESVTEIMVNTHREIFVERRGRIERSPYQFSSDRTVYSVIERIITPLGRRIDESSPIVDARLKDGSRVNAIIPPLALKGPSLTIRKFPKHRLAFSDLIEAGSVDARMVAFLRVCVEMRKNIIVSGGTGSGKTTLLNVLSNFIPDSDRIVTIEDAAELKLVQPNLVALESRPPNLEGKGAVLIRDLVKNALRMRPDRIVVGECRGGEALDMLQAMNTGHDGSLTTIHANNPRDSLSRLEVLVLMAGMDLPITAIREQVTSAVDLIIQQSRFPCGARKITRITEVVGMESGTVQLQDIFVFRQDGVDEERRVRGRFVATGAVPTFYEELREMGIEVDLAAFDNAAGF